MFSKMYLCSKISSWIDVKDEYILQQQQNYVST